MAGAYCKFCDHRCFVLRVIPDGPQKGWTGHLATCARGKAHDREQTGYDADTATSLHASFEAEMNSGRPNLDNVTDPDVIGVYGLEPDTEVEGEHGPDGVA